MVDPRDMLLYAEVARRGSFTAAAAALELSKQSVSKRISRLEAQLGVRLIERTTRSLRLTDAGAAYLERCTQIRAEIEVANAEAQGYGEEPIGRLRVSMPAAYGRRHLAELLGRLRRRHPRLVLEVELADRHVDLVAEGFDVAIRVGELEDSSLIARRIGVGRVHVVASPDYLRAHGRPGPATLTEHDCIGRRSRERWTVRGVVVEVQPVVVVANLEAACAAAVEGIGIARIPSFLHRDATESGALELLFGGIPVAQRNLYAVYPSRTHLAPKVTCFVEAAEEQVAELFPIDV